MSSAATALPDEPKPLSEAERVIDTFVAPTKTFTDLRRSANWLVPAVLLILGTLAVVWTAQTKIGFQKIVDTQLQTQPKAVERLDKLDPDTRAKQMESIVKLNQTISYFFPVILLVWLFIVAAVLLGTFNFGLGTELTFNQCMAVCVYASLPGVVKGILTIIVILLGATENFTFQNPIASNLGGLVDPTSHFLYTFLVSVDIFTIWTLILTGLAFSCLTRVKRGTCMAVVFGWWLAFTLGSSAIGAIFA